MEGIMSKKKCIVNHKIGVMHLKNKKYTKALFCKVIGITSMTLHHHEINPDMPWRYNTAVKISKHLNIPIDMIPHEKENKDGKTDENRA
jgi:DNA-binding XRE family transcriptional regulator